MNTISLSVFLIGVKQLPVEKHTHIFFKCSDSFNLKVIPLLPKCFSMSLLQANSFLAHR